MALCLCLSASVTSHCSIETGERIELVWGMGASFHLSYTVLKGNSGISSNKGTPLWNFVPNYVDTCYQLSPRKVDAQRVINWTVVDQLS